MKHKILIIWVCFFIFPFFLTLFDLAMEAFGLWRFPGMIVFIEYPISIIGCIVAIFISELPSLKKVLYSFLSIVAVIVQFFATGILLFSKSGFEGVIQ